MRSCQLGARDRSPESARTSPSPAYTGKQLERFSRVDRLSGKYPDDCTHHQILHRNGRDQLSRLFGAGVTTNGYDPGTRRWSTTAAPCDLRRQRIRKRSLLPKSERWTDRASHYWTGIEPDDHRIGKDQPLQAKLKAGFQSRSLVDEPKWHHQTHIRRRILPTLRFYRRRPLRSLEGQTDFISRDITQDLQQITGIETNVELVTGVANRELVLGFAEIRSLHAEI